MIITNIVVSVMLVTNVGPQINPILFSQGLLLQTNVMQVKTASRITDTGTTNTLTITVPAAVD